MILSSSTVTFASLFGAHYPGDEATVRGNGGLVHGVRLACYLHPEPVSREEYGRAEWVAGCTIVLNDKYACHVNDHGEVWFTEDAGWFRYRAQRWLQPWRTLEQVCRDAEKELRRPWTWDTLIRPGAITLLVGPPKLGKTTLVFDALSSMASNEGLCLGLAQSKANVLYVSEEGEVPLAYKGSADRLRAIRQAPYISFLTSYEAGEGWAGLMGLVDRAVVEMPNSPGFLPVGFPLMVVIDTLGFFMGLDDENQAGQVRQALKLLVDRTRANNLACLLIHHTSKQGRQDSQWVARVQGNTAFAGNVDIVAALDGNYEAPRRKLYRVGRFGTSDPLELMYNESEGYRTLTEEERTKFDTEALEAVKGVLRRNARLSIRTVAEETGLSKSAVGRMVRMLNEFVERRGVSLAEYLEEV